MFAVCTTVGCGNWGAVIPIAGTADLVGCGPCGLPVTNITDVPPEQVKELPAWILEKLQTLN